MSDTALSDAQTDIDIGSVFEDTIRSYTDAGVEFNYACCASSTVKTSPKIHLAIEELVRNSIQHNTTPPTIDITIKRKNDTVTVRFSDTGNGIPKNEIEVLQERSEDRLKHGSGCGLWMIMWIVESSNSSFNIWNNDGVEVKMEFVATSD